MIESRDLDNRGMESCGVGAGPSLTGRERMILDIVVQYVRVTGEPCPGRFIARRIGAHHSTIQQRLQQLHRKGWLRGPSSPAFPTRVG